MKRKIIHNLIWIIAGVLIPFLLMAAIVIQPYIHQALIGLFN